MFWPDAVESAIDRAVAAATAGTPTVLDIQGRGGYGKTQLARSVARRFPLAQVLSATAYKDTRSDPFDLLSQLEVPDLGPTLRPLRAARALGGVLDERQHDGPVAMLLDDLQWADAESLDALAVLLERMAGDRLLVIAAHRPAGAGHARWSDALRGVASVVPVALDGLDDATILRLLRESDPAATPALARELHEHTAGSPLFVQSILHEYTVDQLTSLADAHALPATTEVAAAMGRRISQMDASVVSTLSAIAVLGDRGGELFIVRELAGVDEIESAVRTLVDEQLVLLEGRGPTATARIFHGVVRAAVYDIVPPAVRERMHAAAAARLLDPRDRLRHRVAAARDVDEGLALDLDAFADALHERERFREAARLRRQGAQLSATATTRLRRMLDADFEAILSLDLDEVSTGDHAWHADPYERIVIGSRLGAELRYIAASDVLSTITDAELSELSALTAYRARVMRAWALVASGRSAHDALADLQAAMAGGAVDPALRGYFAFAYGQASFLVVPVDEGMAVADRLTVDRAQLAATAEGTIELAWRGSVLSLTGMPLDAIGDLALVTGRFGEGLVDFGGGTFHALQAFAHFSAGQWGRASIMLDLARTGRLRDTAPITITMLPLAGAIAGDPDRARTAIEVGRRARLDAPQPVGVQAGDIVEVILLFLLGTDAERAVWLHQRTVDFGSPDVWMHTQVPYLWYVVHGIAAEWAGEAERVREWSALLRTPESPVWGDEIADWLDERTDRTPAGDRALAARARRGLPSLPLFDAMRRLEAARRADPASRAALRAEAEAAFTAMGADKLAAVVLPVMEQADVPVTGSGPVVDAPSVRSATVLAGLSDREREVATLLLEGLSYAQIARELFITRSTVAFHLSNIYAKSGVTTKHEFVAASRAG